MRKSLGLLVMLALFGVFILGGQTAVEAAETDWGYISPYAGVSYNTFDIDGTDWDMENITYDDSEDSGIGFFLGARHWFEDEAMEGMAVGGEFDWLGTVELSDGDREAEVSTMGFLATGAYRLSELSENMPEELYATLAGGIYRASFEAEDDLGDVMDETYRGPGVKVGIQGAFPVQDNIAIGGRAQYRYAQPHSEGDLDYNGFELGAQVELTF